VEKHEMISYEELSEKYSRNDTSIINDEIFGKYFYLENCNFDNPQKIIVRFKNIPSIQKGWFEQFYHDVIFQTKIEIWKNIK
jgi:hypothetical protein